MKLWGLRKNEVSRDAEKPWGLKFSEIKFFLSIAARWDSEVWMYWGGYLKRPTSESRRESRRMLKTLSNWIVWNSAWYGLFRILLHIYVDVHGSRLPWSTSSSKLPTNTKLQMNPSWCSARTKSWWCGAFNAAEFTYQLPCIGTHWSSWWRHKQPCEAEDYGLKFSLELNQNPPSN